MTATERFIVRSRHFVASIVAIAIAGVPVIAAAAPQAAVTVSGTARKEAKRPYDQSTVRARSVGDGSIAVAVPLDASGDFVLSGLQPSSYVLELLNRDGKVVCTEGPLNLMKTTAKISINCGRDRAPLYLLLAAAGAAGLAAGIAAGGDASPSR